ncbi:Uncharacterized protein FWK35_00003953, partial [Aphis craccivora]
IKKFSTTDKHSIFFIKELLMLDTFITTSLNHLVGKWVPLCCTLGAIWIIIIYYRSVKFESNDRYHCIRKTILNADDLSA